MGCPVPTENDVETVIFLSGVLQPTYGVVFSLHYALIHRKKLGNSN